MHGRKYFLSTSTFSQLMLARIHNPKVELTTHAVYTVNLNSLLTRRGLQK